MTIRAGEVTAPDGYDIYQVKRYSRALMAKQATSVENSWDTFTAETLPVLPVCSWTLVIPWEPTNERPRRWTSSPAPEPRR
ncbi:hypothetical protein GCM10022226_46260 [Sphaerisporangium flaviroseum]|uniref:Uncharacterized protein n=1 Tax=Sphaerisporangium flaviroseum TaxID=509199 RepID=A0ABP7IKI7_9ACTN